MLVGGEKAFPRKGRCVSASKHGYSLPRGVYDRAACPCISLQLSPSDSDVRSTVPCSRGRQATSNQSESHKTTPTKSPHEVGGLVQAQPQQSSVPALLIYEQETVYIHICTVSVLVFDLYGASTAGCLRHQKHFWMAQPNPKPAQ